MLQTSSTGTVPANVAGFNAASGFTATDGSDIVSGLTFSAPGGATVTGGSNAGYYHDANPRFNFDLPGNALIIGLSAQYGYYIDSLALAYCASGGARKLFS